MSSNKARSGGGRREERNVISSERVITIPLKSSSEPALRGRINAADRLSPIIKVFEQWGAASADIGMNACTGG